MSLMSCRRAGESGLPVRPALYGPASWLRANDELAQGRSRRSRGVCRRNLDPDCTYMVDLDPDELLSATNAVLDAFEAELPTLAGGDDKQVFAVVERIVLALNAVNEAHDERAFECLLLVTYRTRLDLPRSPPCITT
jgi:hypothetical protein